MRNDLKAAVEYTFTFLEDELADATKKYQEAERLRIDKKNNPEKNWNWKWEDGGYWPVHHEAQAQKAKNLTTALAALRDALKRQPDPITGLVPCGCGGVAISEDYFGDDDVESSYRAFVSCEKCELRTPDYPRLFDAKEAWNTAMGRKGGAE